MSTLRQELHPNTLRPSIPHPNLQTSRVRSLDLHTLLGHLSLHEQPTPMHTYLLLLGQVSTWTLYRKLINHHRNDKRCAIFCW